MKRNSKTRQEETDENFRTPTTTGLKAQKRCTGQDGRHTEDVIGPGWKHLKTPEGGRTRGGGWWNSLHR